MARARWTAILLTLVLSASVFALPALGAPKASDLGGGAQKAGKSGDTPGHNKDQTSPDDQSPGDQAGAKPSPSPQPSASPSAPPKPPTGTGGQGSGSPDESAPPEAAQLSTSVSASPSTILVGETSHVVAQVTNTGDSTASSLTVEISVPSQLDIMDAGPEPFESVNGGDTVRFHLGSLPAGESAEAWLDLEGGHQTSPSGATVMATATSGELVSSGSAQIVVVGSTGNENLELTTSSNRLLVQLGELVNYSITVTNVGDTTLHDVIVVDRLPGEIRYHSVAYTPAVDAVQVGESGDEQDIVWVKNSLRPGRSITVRWTGRAASLGDFAAINSVTVKADEVRPINEERTTYLGTVAVSGTSNPPFDPIVKTRRIERTITQPVEGAQGSLLPITGLEDPTPLVVALVLIALGGLALWSRRWREPSRKWTAIALAVVLTASAACVDNEPDATATKPDAGQSKNEPKKDKKKQEVRGRRIQKNGNGNGNGDGGQTGAEPGGDPSGDPVDPASPPVAPPVVAAPAPTTPVPTEEVTVTRRVVTTIGLGDLPIDVLGARPSDNQMSYTWNEAAGKITRATSSVVFTKGATVELMTELGFGGDQIDVTVVVRNLSRNRRLAVSGNLIHDVSGSSDSIASFSAPVDTVLAPGGETSARFTYLLPSGDYDVSARFQPN